MINVSTAALKTAVSIVGHAVERKTTLPILGHLLCRLDDDGDRLSLTASNLEITVTTEIDVETSGNDTPGEWTLPADRLTSLLNVVRAEQLKLSPANERATITAGSARFSVGMLPATDYPQPAAPQRTSFAIAGATLRTMLEATLPAAGVSDARFYLNGVSLQHLDGDLVMIATDGKRLHVARHPLPAQINPNLIIPRGAARTIARLLPDEEVTLAYSESDLTAKLGTTTATTKLVDGRYPDWERTVSRDETATVTCNAMALRQAVNACRVLSSKTHHGVRLEIADDRIRLSASNTDAEEANDELTVQHIGKPVEIGFCADYLCDAIDALSGSDIDFTIASTEQAHLRAAKPTGDVDVLATVMAMRL